MEGVLWYLLAGARGGPNRCRILLALDEQPRNANQLATQLELDYTTIRHHLDILLENNVVNRVGNDYGAVYVFTEQTKANWETVDEILTTVETEEA